ncbi:MAG TPA: proline dehydrogenase family protein [Candidatus Limnocylindrales bacterium]
MAHPTRRILLWMARSEWLRGRVPRLPFARRAVRRFMPGETLADALVAARALADQGQGIVFTRLGENLRDISEADAVAAHYHGLLDESVAVGLVPEISVKLTQLGLDIDPDVTLRHCLALAEHADRVGSSLWLDMEASGYVDATLDLYTRILAAHPRTGICLQAYLRRSAADVVRLLPLHPSIRLVKGAYDEPVSVAFRSKVEIDASFQSLALLIAATAMTDGAEATADGASSTAGGGTRLIVGTHDSALVERIAAFGAATGIPRSVFAVAMLYGIRVREASRLAALGYPVRTLIAYGEFWYPWYMRRLAERPANVLFALRQVLP